jgi:mono/diheme cytochrome c family protein
MKESLFKRIFSLRNLFLWGNILLLVLFLLAFVKDANRGWKPYQREFKSMEVEHAKSLLASAKTDVERIQAEGLLKEARKLPVEIRQIWSTEMSSIDRCITCHIGYDPLYNTSLTNEHKEHPYSASSSPAALEAHTKHNLQKFGCVVCHGGQGMATEKQAAHGRVPHWEKPLMSGTLMQAACVQCHDNHAELKLGGQVYTSEIVRAKQLFRDSGCIGCHQIGGEGGPVSVDLKFETASKPISRIDFSSTGLSHEEWTLTNWIRLHLVQDPAIAVPGDPKGAFNTEPISPSAMPPYLMNDKDADAITAYILSMNRSNIKPQFLTLRAQPSEPSFGSSVQHGRYVYEKYGCAGCHGPQARGGVRNYNYQYDVTPNLRRAVATYSREELKDKISNGVPFIAKHDPKGPNPPLYMPAWKDKIKGQELEDLVSYLFSIKE